MPNSTPAGLIFIALNWLAVSALTGIAVLIYHSRKAYVVRAFVYAVFSQAAFFLLAYMWLGLLDYNSHWVDKTWLWTTVFNGIDGNVVGVLISQWIFVFCGFCTFRIFKSKQWDF